MAIELACSCGKRFAAKDDLAGKTVRCPGCAQPLTIPLPQPVVQPVAAAQEAVEIACRCGARFRAQSHLRGQQVACPRCGGALLVPAPAANPLLAELASEDPLDADDGFSYDVAQPVARTTSVPLPTRPVSSGARGGRRKEAMPESAKMAGGGLFGIAVVIVVVVIGINALSGPGDIDAMGQNLNVLAICLAVAAGVSAVLIWTGVPVIGLVVGGLVAVALLPVFPIGTALSVYTLFKLLDPQTRAYLGA